MFHSGEKFSFLFLKTPAKQSEKNLRNNYPLRNHVMVFTEMTPEF